MAKTRPPYAPGFRRQIIELVCSGRNPTDRAREFEPSEQAIRNWVAPADRSEGRREEKSNALTDPIRKRSVPADVYAICFRVPNDQALWMRAG